MINCVKAYTGYDLTGRAWTGSMRLGSALQVRAPPAYGSLAVHMKIPPWFVVLLPAFLAASCSDAGGAVDGGLSLKVLSPAGVDTSCCGPFAASVRFELSCTTESGLEVKTGELQAVEVSESFVSWEIHLDGVSPGECVLHLVARDPSDEVYCTASEPVTVVAGDFQEPQVVLLCTLSLRPRPDLTDEERRVCIEAGSPCFTAGDDSF